MNDVESGGKHPVHSPLVERHNEPIIVFLTVCSKDRKEIFASRDIAGVIIDAWVNAKTWLVGRYVIMPDHIHLFCAPGVNPTEPLDQWVRYWKNVASKNWPRLNEHPIWQRDFGIPNCDGMKTTMRNGITFLKIRFVLVWSDNQNIGHSTES